MYLKRVTIALLLSFFAVPAAWATADGPDTWEIISERPVPLFASARTNAPIIRDVAPNSRGVKNLGCQGRPAFDAWIKMTDEERQAARAKVWCRVAFAGSEGWLRGIDVGEPTGKAPAYDCSKAEGAVEELICRDGNLAEFDHLLTGAYWAAMVHVLDQDFKKCLLSGKINVVG